MTNAKLDSLVYSLIQAHGPIRFDALLALVAASVSAEHYSTHFRPVDNTLKRLRKRNLIHPAPRRAGWQTVRGVRPS